ncbi:hypothetical protein BJS_09039 [Bradyrhizobium japonicum SEMIA 5079]|nr:hypothetical protein BJS_09039 [Bradyrhizobium japonicum SEMIA 5079]
MNFTLSRANSDRDLRPDCIMIDDQAPPAPPSGVAKRLSKNRALLALAVLALVLGALLLLSDEAVTSRFHYKYF